jgi:hypothetical protein
MKQISKISRKVEKFVLLFDHPIIRTLMGTKNLIKSSDLSFLHENYQIIWSQICLAFKRQYIQMF